MKRHFTRMAMVCAAAVLSTHAVHARALPASFSPPAGFIVEDKSSKTFDFFHEEIAYPEAGRTTRIDPEGKTWVLYMRLSTPNKTSDATDATMRAALKTGGWTILTPSGVLVAHKVAGGVNTWFSGTASSGDFRATIVEVGPAPHSLTLPAPAAVPETVGAGDDFPYLKSFPGSKLVKTVPQPTKAVNVAATGGRAQPGYR